MKYEPRCDAMPSRHRPAADRTNTGDPGSDALARLINSNRFVERPLPHWCHRCRGRIGARSTQAMPRPPFATLRSAMFSSWLRLRHRAAARHSLMSSLVPPPPSALAALASFHGKRVAQPILRTASPALQGGVKAVSKLTGRPVHSERCGSSLRREPQRPDQPDDEIDRQQHGDRLLAGPFTRRRF